MHRLTFTLFYAIINILAHVRGNMKKVSLSEVATILGFTMTLGALFLISMPLKLASALTATLFLTGLVMLGRHKQEQFREPAQQAAPVVTGRSRKG